MISRSKALLTLALTLVSATALANGAVTERKAGGLVFKKSDTIGIASDELFVSREEIRASYLYEVVFFVRVEDPPN